jgi:hypothetical protein
VIFSKACAVEGSAPSAEGEISHTAFLFDNFFFAPTSRKEKVAKEFVRFQKMYAFDLQPMVLNQSTPLV